MWTRKEIKTSAKEALNRNYWRIVLIAFFAILIGLNVNYSFSSKSFSNDKAKNVVAFSNGFKEGFLDEEYREDFVNEQKSDYELIRDEINSLDDKSIPYVVGCIFGAMLVVLIVVAALVAFRVFVCNPIQIGIARFMIKSNDDVAKVSEVAYAFDHNYKNNVRVMFHTGLRIFLWSLLFVIPGIIKAYQYRMVDYIMSENPDMSYKDAMAMSKKMMNGNKWKTFILDLSFIPWNILGFITFGIVGIFYVAPYVQLTRAAQYRKLQSLQVAVEA